MAKPTDSQQQFLQLVCVVLVMMTLVSLVAAYLMYRDVYNLEIEVSEAKATADRYKAEIFEQQKEITTLKTVMGYAHMQTGEADDVEAATIAGKVKDDIKRYAGTPKSNLRDALIELHTQLLAITMERNTLQKQLEKLSATPAINPN